MPDCTQHFRPVDPREAVEFDAFLQLLPTLQQTRPGDHVAVCGGAVIASGKFASRVHDAAVAIAEGRAFYLGWVEPAGGWTVMSGLFEVRGEA
jgi:hypothetical protein